MVKKDSLIKGTLILAAAALVARFLGLFQRIPLDYMMGKAGGSYYGEANNIYLMLLIVATGGIPSAISKMISERYATNRFAEARRIYRAAIWFGILTGVLSAVLLYVLAPFISTHIFLDKDASSSIRAIAPALLLFPLIAMMRGYFQGRQMMAAGGMSQIVEQILRVLTATGLALVVLSWGWGDRWIAAAAMFGSVFGSVGAFAIMLINARKLRRLDKAEAASRYAEDRSDPAAAKAPFMAIYKDIFKISVPIVIASMTVQFIYNFDTMFFHRLTDSFYGGLDRSQAILDAFSIKAQAMSGIPPILAIALSTSIIPVISSAYSVRNMKEVERQTSLVMRIVVFTGVPVALMMTVASVSITGFLFPNTYGSGAVAALTAGTIFQITMMTSSSVLFGMGKPRRPMMHTFAGIGVKVIASLILSPLLGVYGLILSSTLCFLTIATLNLRAIRQEVPLSVLGSRWGGYLATIAVASAAGWLVDMGFRSMLGGLPAKLMYLVSASAAGLVSFALYMLLLTLLRVVTAEDVRQFPGPLRKLMSPIIRITARHAANSNG
ncbi:putative polysaccharide biosynthesis protein [Paenibacillus humicola]|uniref:putative polysaccharide biosynthesis protein n=1 Tax=Paenibacillus humicola TaxID=3110540 RepID=UPI00237A9912|nr:polysaccharide biosynthesis protein [Paenibacillus humicola]